MRHAVLLLGLSAATPGFGAAPAGPATDVRADDPHVRYVGRFDRRDPAGPRCEWPAAAVTLRFRGTGLRATIDESGQDDYQIVVDNRPTRVLHPGPGQTTQDVATGLPDGEHTVSIVKRTEALVGRGQFRGFALLGDATLLDVPAAPRHVEVIGDSISCGYGNEAANEKEHFRPQTENGYLAYGAVAARAVGADYTCVAWSGKKLWPDNTIPDLYDRALPTDASSRWAFDPPAPDAVLINLATNDFAPGVPDGPKWTAAYVDFVRRVRGHYPKAMIYLASGSMMSDAWPPGQHALSTLNAYLDRVHATLAAAGDARVRVLHFPPQDGAADGLGADYHPSVRTDANMAAVFAAALAHDLNWQAVGTP